MKKKILFPIAALMLLLLSNPTQAQKESKEVSTRPLFEGEMYIKNMEAVPQPSIGRQQSVVPYALNGNLLKGGLFKKVELIGIDASGRPLAIQGSPTDDVSNRSKTMKQRSYEHLSALAEVLMVQDPINEFELVSTDIDKSGEQHLKFQQVYKGIPVYGAELLVHTKQGVIDFTNGRYQSTPSGLSTTPSITDVAAESTVKSSFTNYKEIKKSELDIFKMDQFVSELVIYVDNEAKLAYHVTAYENLVHRYEYFVDAKSGNVIDSYLSICKFHNHIGQNEHQHSGSCNHSAELNNRVSVAKSSSTKQSIKDGAVTATAQDLFNINRTINTYEVGSDFYLIDGSREKMFEPGSVLPNEPEGVIWTIDAFNTSPQLDNFRYDHVSSNNNSWSSKVSVSAHYNGAIAYEYFDQKHVRNSINGSGGNIISLINVSDEDGRSMGNAFWNGQAMFYGNGDSNFKELARGLDVAGHEMTHGVVQNSANLEYRNESGALNESFADVFGVLIDRDDWLVGEDVVKSGFPGGALRSMSDPHNGASTGDFGSGWQPKKYSERFTGSQDNGGVHINSGIPNHAFFLFASKVGKDTAEKVYYEALTRYLTKSSQFIDARIAVVRASEQFGASVVDAAKDAFDEVEIFDGEGGTYQNDVEVNPGSDLLLFTNNQNQNLFIFATDGTEVANPLTETDPISTPSVTDNGSLVAFVGSDKMIHFVTIDWTAGSTDEQTLNITGPNQWRNVAVSKDGTLMAALEDDINNRVVIFDLTSGGSNAYTLINPTSADGVTTGDVLYADAMEFDFNNEFLMYDAENEIESQTAGSIKYWDISFIKVWNPNFSTFALADQVEKLFSGLPEDVSIGNPTFSSNSPYIVAFDFIEGTETSVLGANIETGQVGLIYENNTIAYPSFSRADNLLVFDNDGNSGLQIGRIGINETKIQGVEGSAAVQFEGARWGTFFSNGSRDITNVQTEEIVFDMRLSPLPVSNILTVTYEAEKSADMKLTIIDSQGKTVNSQILRSSAGRNEVKVNATQLSEGMYFLTLMNEEGETTRAFMKQ